MCMVLLRGVRMVRAGASGVDYSAARPSPVLMAANGVEFVCRYLTESTFKGKKTSTVELEGLWNVGIAAVPNGESGANTALGGRAQGLTDGDRFVRALEVLQCPTDIPVPISHDTSAWSDQVPLYFEAVWERMAAAGWALKATYGSGRLSSVLQARGHELALIWATAAWRWPGGVAPDAHVHQGRTKIDNTKFAKPGEVDPNLAVRPFRAWLRGASVLIDPGFPPVIVTPPRVVVFTPPPPVPEPILEEDEVRYVTLTSTRDPANTRPERIMALDGCGWTVTPPLDDAADAKAVRVAYGDDPNVETEPWAPFMDVSAGLYDKFVAGPPKSPGSFQPFTVQPATE